MLQHDRMIPLRRIQRSLISSANGVSCVYGSTSGQGFAVRFQCGAKESPRVRRKAKLQARSTPLGSGRGGRSRVGSCRVLKPQVLPCCQRDHSRPWLGRSWNMYTVPGLRDLSGAKILRLELSALRLVVPVSLPLEELLGLSARAKPGTRASLSRRIGIPEL